MMSYNEYKAICAAKVAGPQKETSTSSNLTETPEDQNKVFTFIDETYRDIRRYYSGLRKDNISTQLLQTINKYKSGCNAVFNKALESNNACHKLSQNIVRTIDIFKELCECLTDLEEYNYRLCEIISIFVACELRLSVDAAPQEKLLTAHRIVYIMRRHLVQEEEQETLYNILRTLVFIPRLFDARDIMCAIFGIFIPIKPMAEVKILPDKLYMLYIIIFYRWMMMQENDDNKMSIVNFAESFMKPSVSLCSNKLYAAFLPMYNTHSTATRTILNNLKCYRDLRNATIINNALNKIGALVNLCDDEDDDIIVIETSPATDFQKIFASVHLEPLSGSMSNIKLEEKTVVGTVDLTAEEEPSNSPTSIRARHEKWLNEFHRLAKQHRESQLLLERQQNIQQISENRIEAVICLDSDSEDDEEITAAANASKKTTQATISKELYQTPAKTQQNNAEDLFVDSYPLTTTPINCEYDFESLDAEDENDVTKISPRFLTGTLRTYEGKKSNLLEKEDKRNSDDDDTHNRTQDSEKAYRRDSIHISFSPQERTQNDDDEGTDVQDEHDDMLEEEEETSAYTFLPTTSNKPEKEIFAKQIRPMGPYPTYNNMHNDKVLFSQSLSRYPQQQSHQQYHDKQYYYSDSSETKTPKKQKKRVHFNSSPLGPTVSMASQKTPLKSALQQSKYKASEAPDVFHLRGFERLSFASSIAGSTSTTASNSTSSSTKQQEPTNEIYNNLSNNNVKNHNHNNNSSDIKAKSTKKFKKDLKKQRPDNDISSCAPSIAGSNATTISTSSSIKQQEPTNEICNNHSTINVKNHNNKCSNLYKNLSVFNQNCLKMNVKQKSVKKFKIKLKKFKLENDISLTNFKSYRINKKQPHTTTLVLNNNNDDSNKISNNNFTESCQLKDNPNSTLTQNVDDDLIFKKPLPLTKKMFKSPRPLKIHKVVSLRKNPYYHIKPKDMLKAMKSKTKYVENAEKISDHKDKSSPLNDDRQKTGTELSTTFNDMEMDDLSKVSKLLTDQINSLTCKTEKKEINQSNDSKINKGLEKELSKETENILSNNLTLKSMQSDNEESKLAVEQFSDSREDQENPGCLNKTLESSKTPDAKENLINLNSGSETINQKQLSEEQEKTNKIEDVMTNENKQESEAIETKICIIADPAEHSEFNSDQKKNGNPQTYSLDVDNEIEQEDPKTQQNYRKPVTNFCAEFLAGLPNEPSPHVTDPGEKNGHDEDKNNVDFEFENNCLTPTPMCRIDLDVMTDNTSDVHASMPIALLSSKESEADKLLEDFNHKTEDIVDSSLCKKPLVSEVIVSDHSSPTICSSSISSVPPVSNSFNDSLVNEEEDLIKKSIVIETDKIILKRLRKKEDSGVETICKKSKNMPSDEEGLKSVEKIISLNADVVQPIRVSEVMEDIFENAICTDDKDNNLDCDQSKYSTKSNNQLNLANDLEEPIKSHAKSIKIFSNSKKDISEPNSPKKLKKSNKRSKTLEKLETHPRENTEDAVKSQNDEWLKDNNKNENTTVQSSKDVTQQMEASFNKNQHMTVELDDWKPESQDEIKTIDSDARGVSAIFSFPKIPIISISIRTTSNNKTYFEISNRENDNVTKDCSQTKNIKTSQQNNESENRNVDKNVISSTLDNNELNKNKEKIMQMTAEEYNEEDDEEYEGEPEEDDNMEEEEETDIIEIEKFSHDSNSACSLPLKKRPTQSERNGENEDSQHVTAGNYEQPQEIAAEVIIENTDKDKTIIEDNSTEQLQPEMTQTNKEESETQVEIIKNIPQQINHIEESSNLPSDFDDNKPSTSAACFKKLSDPSSPFKRRIQIPIRPIGQTPIQIVAPQLKDNSLSPSQDLRSIDSLVPQVPRMQTQNVQPLPESYPATPMLSVANVEKLMDFNRFIEDLLASPDVLTIIDNANACGYFADGQAYEMERIAILEHYNIANAKGNTSVTKPLYFKKSAGDTISIFIDNDNEWISLPPSTSKQLLKLSFVLSILQQQYKVSDVRQRINIALTFLIRNTSKFKNNTSGSLLQQRMPLYNRNIADVSNSNQNISHPLPSTSYFRIATNNENLNTNFSINSNIESVQDFHSPNYSNNQPTSELTLQHESTVNGNQNWNNLMQFASSASVQVTEQTSSNSPQRLNTGNTESEQQQQFQTQTQNRRNSSWDEPNNDQLYFNPPCATSPQNEVIVNTNGVELHEMPQDQQNIFISITDESGPANGNSENSLHKYNTRKQQQQNPRSLEVNEPSSSTLSLTQQSYSKRSCFSNKSNASMSNNFVCNNIISTFGNQEINLQNPYRLQQIQQQQTNQNLNTSPKSNFQHRNISSQNLPINTYNNNINSKPLAQQQPPQQRLSTRYSSSLNAQPLDNNRQTPIKSNESNYKEILQPYITYLIKDHEKTSKHLLQVFEEVSNSNPLSYNETINNNFNQTLAPQQQQFNSALPTLIRNPQQNHMPGLHQMTGCNSGNVLPSLIRNPHENTFTNSDSGALQVVQSFLEQSQSDLENTQQQRMFGHQQNQEQSSSFLNPGFAKEYVNFVGSRDEITRKQNLRSFDLEHNQQQLQQTQQQPQQLNNQLSQQRQETQRLNSVKRKCRERNDKLAEDLKHKMIEFSLLKHNVQAQLLEKQLQQQQSKINQMQNSIATAKRRGRPKKDINKLFSDNKTATELASSYNSHSSCNTTTFSSKKNMTQTKSSSRVTRRNQTNNNFLTTSATTTNDHAYFRQRSAAREAVKRINTETNSSI